VLGFQHLYIVAGIGGTVMWSNSEQRKAMQDPPLGRKKKTTFFLIAGHLFCAIDTEGNQL